MASSSKVPALASWKKPSPSTYVATSPLRTSSGTPSVRAAEIAVTVFVSPGPPMTRHAPKRPEARA